MLIPALLFGLFVVAVWLFLNNHGGHRGEFGRVSGFVEGQERCPCCRKRFGEFFPRHSTRVKGGYAAYYVPEKANHAYRGQIICPECYEAAQEIQQYIKG